MTASLEDLARAASGALTATAADCDREAIHIPGSIQPHGALLAFDPGSATVLHASTNLERWLPLSGLPSLGRPMVHLLGEAGFTRMIHALTGASVNGVRHQIVDLPARPAQGQPIALEVVVHAHRGVCMAEILPIPASDPGQDWLLRFGDTIDSLRTAADLDELVASVARRTKRLTGFDRVMVYRFGDDWNGHVVADEREAGMPSFHDLHYPASDIPAQARELYRSNLVRYVADVAYAAVPVLPWLDPERQQPLDMSHAMLRSVSPVHLQYLANMQVGATLTISLLVDGRLWGLISCHHRTALRVPVRLWRACHALAVTAGYMIGWYAQRDRATALVSLSLAQGRVIDAFNLVQAPLPDVIEQCGGSLLRMAGAVGGAFWRGDAVLPFGRWPARDQAAAVLDLARRSLEASMDDVWHTDSAQLPGAPADGEADVNGVHGVMAIRLDAFASSGIVWVRPEFRHEVAWGGNPDKALSVELDAAGLPRLSPRSSFARWLSIVKGYSRPWGELDLIGSRLLAAVTPVLAMRDSLAQVSLSDRRFRGLVALQSDAYCQLDVDGAILMLSRPLPTGERVVEGQSLVALFATACPVPEIDALDLALRSRRPFRDLRLHGAAAGGRAPFVVKVSGEPLRDLYGSMIGWHGTITDATLESAVQSALRLKEAAEMSSLAKSKFLSQISHELRTPLNAVLGFTQLLTMDPAMTPAQLEKLGYVERAGSWLLEMIGDLMDLSRLETGQLALRAQAVDLDALVDTVVLLLESLAATHAVRLVVERERAKAWVRADPSRLKQVIVNLVSNAIKYNRAQGEVWFEVHVDDASGETRLDVRDNGAGLSAAQMAHLFEPFNRLGRESLNIEGTGIGLVIARQLVEAMGGRISVESVEGQGSVFSVALSSAAAPG